MINDTGPISRGPTDHRAQRPVTAARPWPATITWVHISVAVLAPIAAEITHLVVH